MNDLRVFNVLLLEDEEGDAQLMSLALKKTRFSISMNHVCDGIEALAYLARVIPTNETLLRPNLIIADLKMPLMGGLEFLEKIKKLENFCTIPVVVISSSALPSDVENAYRLGAAGYLLKATDMTEFVSAIEGLCEYWIHLVRLPE